MESELTIETEQHFCPDETYLEKLKVGCADFGWEFKDLQKNHLGLMANFTRRKSPLTEPELVALQQVLELGKIESIESAIFDTLVNSRLLDSNGTITKFGFLSLVEEQDLSEQCRMVDLSLREFSVPKQDRAEIDALNYLRREGFDGTYCEGGAILTVLKALCLDWFAGRRPVWDKVGYFSTEQLRENASRVYLESLLVEHHERQDAIADALLSTSTERLVSNFHEIYAHEIVRQSYPGLNEAIIKLIRSAAGDDGLLCILNTLMQNPYLFRKGWPDLTLVRENRLSFVEVKTRDKLHTSQLITIPVIRKATGFDFSVAVVARPRQRKRVDPENEPF